MEQKQNNTYLSLNYQQFIVHLSYSYLPANYNTQIKRNLQILRNTWRLLVFFDSGLSGQVYSQSEKYMAVCFSHRSWNISTKQNKVSLQLLSIVEWQCSKCKFSICIYHHHRNDNNSGIIPFRGLTEISWAVPQFIGCTTTYSIYASSNNM